MPLDSVSREKGSGGDSSVRAGWRAALLPLIMCVPFMVRRVQLLLTPQPLQDFVTYWAAGKLFLSGQNPYSMGATLVVERSLGWPYAHTLIMLNPPWALPFVALLALLPFAVAHTAWLAVSLGIEAVCALALWRYFGGEKRQQWIALVLLATFLPAATAEHMGQITPLILGGITGLLYALRNQRYWLAGACLAVLGLKPHLLYLVLLAVLLWSMQKRRWLIPIAAGVFAAAGSAAAIMFNRSVLGYFHNTVGAAVETPCGVGGALRAVFGVQHVWLQFLPCVVGLVWFAFYWKRYRREWKWEERMPLLLLASLGSAAYFWAHDFEVALPAVVALAIQVGRAKLWLRAGAAYIVVQLIIMNTGDESTKVWISSVSLLWIALYWGVERLAAAAEERLQRQAEAV